MHLFYSNDIIGNTITLDPDESAHCVRVLRLGKDDNVNIIDGLGNLFEAVIRLADPYSCRLEMISVRKVAPQRNFKLHIAIAPTKSIERFEWFVEKSVEIGIDSITPVLCNRSERKVLKAERLQKVIIAAMKQAGIYYRPVLNEFKAFNGFIDLISNEGNRFIANCGPGLKPLSKIDLVKSDVLILIGPEGDFTESEINAAVSTGFVPVSLGPNRLRTETAGIIACSIINNMLS